MNKKKFSFKVKQVISQSREEARKLRHDYIGTEHLLLGLMFDKNVLAIKVLVSLDVEMDELRHAIEQAARNNKRLSGRTYHQINNLQLNKQAAHCQDVRF